MLLQYSEDQRDCLQEVCNVAMGQAGDTLARKLGVFVTLPIPVIQIIPAKHLAASVKSFAEQSDIYAASQLFASADDGSELTGLALVMLADESVDDLQALLPDTSDIQELIVDACHSMASSCLDALSEQWQLNFKSEPPSLVGFETLAGICKPVVADWENVLVVEIDYQLEGRNFNGDLLLLFPDKAINAMAKRLDELLV